MRQHESREDAIAPVLDRMLDAPSATLPCFAADGRLLFLNDAAGSAQVWELADGTARPRTAHRDAVAVLAAGASDSIVFGRDAAGDERVQLHLLPAEGEPRALTAEPRAIHGWPVLSPDGTQLATTANDRDPAHADPVVIDLATGARRRVLEVAGPHEIAGWHPDGRHFVLATAPRSFEFDLLLVDAETGGVSPLTRHDGDWRHMAPRWRADGAGFWLLTDRGRDHLGLAWMQPGGEPRYLYAPPADVEVLRDSPDQSLLAVSVNEGGYSQIRLLDAATGALVEQVAHPRGVVTRLAWRGDGGAIAFDLVRPTAPSSIWLAERGAPARLAFAAGEPPAGTRDYAAIEFPSFDGSRVPGFLALPEGKPPAGGWPVLVWVHGGPAMQALPNWRPDLQTFLAMGIAVLIPNVRGSTGYGRDYAFADDREKRLDSVTDLIAARLWLAQQPWADADAIAIMGQSYGGWMVLMAVTEAPRLWAAAIDFYGIADWHSFFQRTGPWRIAHRAAEYGDPVEDAELLRSLSPLHRADRIACPMLVAQGLTDPRVPPHESRQIVAALRARGVPVEHIEIADEGHGFTKRDNRRQVYLSVARFLARHLLRQP